MWNSETAASGESGLLVTARVIAPASRAALVEATRSGEPPDWLTVMTRTSVRSGRAPYAVVVDMEVRPQGMPSRISSRYFAYSAALSEVPRAVSRTKRGFAGGDPLGDLADARRALVEDAAQHGGLLGHLAGHDPARRGRVRARSRGPAGVGRLRRTCWVPPVELFRCS